MGRAPGGRFDTQFARLTKGLRRPRKPPRPKGGGGSEAVTVEPDRPKLGEGGAAAPLEYDDL
jgi:hypothetical protein